MLFDGTSTLFKHAIYQKDICFQVLNDATMLKMNIKNNFGHLLVIKLN